MAQAVSPQASRIEANCVSPPSSGRVRADNTEASAGVALKGGLRVAVGYGRPDARHDAQRHAAETLGLALDAPRGRVEVGPK